VLTQAEDIKAVLRDPRFVQWSLCRSSAIRPSTGVLSRGQQQLPGMEGADHARLRRLTGRR